MCAYLRSKSARRKAQILGQDTESISGCLTLTKKEHIIGEDAWATHACSCMPGTNALVPGLTLTASHSQNTLKPSPVKSSSEEQWIQFQGGVSSGFETPAFEPKRNHFTGFNDFHPKARNRIWPWRLYVCRVRPKAVLWIHSRPRKADIRLPGKEDSNFHGARPVY